MRLRTGEVQTDQASLDDHFHIVGIAPAIVAVVHPHHGKLLRPRLVDGDLGGVVYRHIANIVAAIEECRPGRLVDYAYGLARLVRLGILGNGEDARQTGKRITA